MIKKCPYCNGTGEVATMEAVDPREPHLQADVGTAPCPECFGTGEIETDEEDEEDDEIGGVGVKA